MDARNFVDDIILKYRDGELPQYDFIYEDAINDYSVPFQLTTTEFNDKIVRLLKEDGLYIVNLIDTFDTGLFLGAMVNTIEKTFPYVSVITERDLPTYGRNTFLIITSKQPCDFTKLAQYYPETLMNLWVLESKDIDKLRNKANNVVITDDYAPLENFLIPVVRQSAKEFLAGRLLRDAHQLRDQGKTEKSLEKYHELLKVNSPDSIRVYNEMAMMQAAQGRLDEAITNLHNAIRFNEQQIKPQNMATIHNSLAVAYQQKGDNENARKYYQMSVTGYQEILAQNPHHIKTLTRLGDALATLNKFQEAAGYFQKAVDIEPSNLDWHFRLIQAFEYAGELDKAIQANKKSLAFFEQYNQKSQADELRNYLELLEFKRQKK